jgi:hypothetical protein
MRFQLQEVNRESQLHVNHLIYITKYIQIEIFNPTLQPIIFNTSDISVELNWPFNYTKSLKFNKFSIIYKTNDSNKELYFIQKGIITF